MCQVQCSEVIRARTIQVLFLINSTRTLEFHSVDSRFSPFRKEEQEERSKEAGGVVDSEARVQNGSKKKPVLWSVIMREMKLIYVICILSLNVNYEETWW